MSEPLTRHLPDVHDAMQITYAELKYHARRLRETVRASHEQRAALERSRVAQVKRTTRETHALKMADDYDRAAVSVRRLLQHVAKRVDAQRAPSDPTAISLHGHARASTSDDESDTIDAAPHDGASLSPEE